MFRNKLLNYFQKLCKFSFGDFERQEFIRFCQLGITFTFIIGNYATLRPIKDAVFIGLVNSLALPYAKILSIIALLPIVMIYSKFLDKISKRKMLMIIPVIYGSLFVVFGSLIFWIETCSVTLAEHTPIFLFSAKLIGYLWYIIVESFGSILVALFWAFATNSTDPNSATRGFPLIVAFGQFGGIITPYFIGGLPYRYGFTSNGVAIILIGILTFGIILAVRNLFESASLKEALNAFNTSETSQTREKQIINNGNGSLVGLKLIINNLYLLGIFLVVLIYELLTTILDFNFKIAAAEVYSGVALTNYLSIYVSTVNIVAFLSLILGINNLTRFLGMGAGIVIMPIVYFFCLSGFLIFNSLNVLFGLMVCIKSFNYALNSPVLKQLYIPTHVAVRFKAQAWIEAFGTRLGKGGGSVNNMFLNFLQVNFGLISGHFYYLLMVASIGFPLLLVWLIFSIFLRNRFATAVTEKSFIC